MSASGPAEITPEIIKYQPVGDHHGLPSGEGYLVGGFDLVANALRTWRFDPDQGIVGVPIDRDISTMLVDAGYDQQRALDVTAAAVALVMTADIDKSI
jgi:hypothetical protein